MNVRMGLSLPFFFSSVERKVVWNRAIGLPGHPNLLGGVLLGLVGFLGSRNLGSPNSLGCVIHVGVGGFLGSLLHWHFGILVGSGLLVSICGFLLRALSPLGIGRLLGLSGFGGLGLRGFCPPWGFSILILSGLGASVALLSSTLRMAFRRPF